MNKCFVGSCSEDSVGIGYILIGTEWKMDPNEEGTYLLLTDSGWIPCYDIMSVTGTVESPMTWEESK